MQLLVRCLIVILFSAGLLFDIFAARSLKKSLQNMGPTGIDSL
jgi:hypothetical protein